MTILEMTFSFENTIISLDIKLSLIIKIRELVS